MDVVDRSRILVVEDDKISQNLLVSMIRIYFPDLRILTADNGLEGLELFKAHPQDLVLTDITMPVMDGLTMAGELRLINPKLNMIVVTAHNDQEYRNKLKNAGIDRFLFKPINMEELNSLLRQSLQEIASQKNHH